MSSIFKITETLSAIMSEIEENDGLISPEQEKSLVLTEKELSNKVENYVNFIKKTTSDVDAIDAEIKRLQALKKAKNNLVTGLKRILIGAIQLFGTQSKSGVPYIDYGTGKVSVRKSEAVEINEDCLSRAVNRLMSMLQFYSRSNQLFESEVNLPEIFDYINNADKMDEVLEGNVIPVEIEDMEAVDLKLTVNIPLKRFFEDPDCVELMKKILQWEMFTTEYSVSKTDLKKEFKATGRMPVFAELKENKNLVIK